LDTRLWSDPVYDAAPGLGHSEREKDDNNDDFSPAKYGWVEAGGGKERFKKERRKR